MHLFFDLDGTLTDSSPGILRCIDHALSTVGCSPLPHDRVLGMVGAPLSTIFQALIQSSDDELIDRAVEAYRSRFNSVGIFENALFPGILEMLAAFREAGHRLQIVTAKPHLSAKRVVEHFQIAHFFDAVQGPELHQRSCDKADLVAAALERANCEPAGCAMIGDRADDVRAARSRGVPAIAVAWGYGSRDELMTAGAAYLAEQVADLVDWVAAAERRRHVSARH